MENSTDLRNWVDVDADEQEYLDLLASFGEGFVDLTRMTVDIMLNESGEAKLENS